MYIYIYIYTYTCITQKDYQWWWRSFFASGSSAVYVFLYSILYYNTRSLNKSNYINIAYVSLR